MGAFLSKSGQIKDKDGVEVVPNTPTIPTTSNKSTPKKLLLDPRSPNPYRTPISDLTFKDAKIVSKAQDLRNNDYISTSTTTTPTKLKTKLLRDLGYTLDPRSPTINFDRTPLNFDDPNMTEDFSLAGLSLNESDVQTPIKGIHVECFYTPVAETLKLPGAEIDPRSPSIDIERTPLNLNILPDEIQENVVESDIESDVVEPDAVKVGADTPTLGIADANVIIETVKNMIYMDDHQEQPMTPNRNSANVEKDEKKRTPLSCLINTQGADNRIERRLLQNKSSLARSIFKESMQPANHSASKMTNSSSRIPVLRRSCSKELN